jgi:hypothetical protein
MGRIPLHIASGMNRNWEKSVFVLDFKHTSRQAFFHGVMKGMAAPMMLYHVEQFPFIPAPEPIRSDIESASAALARDWARVGDDMRAAIDFHVKAAN